MKTAIKKQARKSELKKAFTLPKGLSFDAHSGWLAIGRRNQDIRRSSQNGSPCFIWHNRG